MITEHKEQTFLHTNIFGREIAFYVWILLYRLWKINQYMNYWIHYGTLKGCMPGASYMECFWSEKVSSTNSMASQVKLNSVCYYIYFSFETCCVYFTLLVPHVSLKVGLTLLGKRIGLRFCIAIFLDFIHYVLEAGSALVFMWKSCFGGSDRRGWSKFLDPGPWGQK